MPGTRTSPSTAPRIRRLHADPDAMYRHVINHGYAEGRKGYSRDDSENARLLICESAHRIASDAMSNRDKIRAVHDWIVINTRYDVENCGSGTIPYYDCSYSSVMLRRTGVCEEYASAFQYFIWVLDIPCGAVSSADHAWNKVRLGGVWYCIDVTRDDPVPDEGESPFPFPHPVPTRGYVRWSAKIVLSPRFHLW